MSYEKRPLLNTDEQIEHLIKKGVKFEKISQGDAREYLNKNNNYFKLRAYRKNFAKHPGGEKEGQYINLDFAMLQDLSIIDMRLRYLLIHLALDIEHFAKVRLLKKIEEKMNDGYIIVENYLAFLEEKDKENSKRLIQGLLKGSRNPYCGGIIHKFRDGYPVWAFVEIISLGSFNDFYKFCADKLECKEMKDEFYLLATIRELRNAAAHSNCILHDMSASDAVHKADDAIHRELSLIGKATRHRKLGNERMRQIVTLLYTHKKLVASEGVRDAERAKLKEFVQRMDRHIDYYEGNETILTNFEFLKKVVDIFFP